MIRSKKSKIWLFVGVLIAAAIGVVVLLLLIQYGKEPTKPLQEDEFYAYVHSEVVFRVDEFKGGEHPQSNCSFRLSRYGTDSAGAQQLLNTKRGISLANDLDDIVQNYSDCTFEIISGKKEDGVHAGDLLSRAETHGDAVFVIQASSFFLNDGQVIAYPEFSKKMHWGNEEVMAEMFDDAVEAECEKAYALRFSLREGRMIGINILKLM